MHEPDAKFCVCIAESRSVYSPSLSWGLFQMFSVGYAACLLDSSFGYAYDFCSVLLIWNRCDVRVEVFSVNIRLLIILI